MSEQWKQITDDPKTLPPVGAIVWLYDGRNMWIGGRGTTDISDWAWGNTYGSIWLAGTEWDGEIETDDEYKPTHWKQLPSLPAGLKP